MIRTLTALGTALVVLAPLGAQAALPPQWQRAAELEAVIQAGTEALGMPIESVILIQDLTYNVSHDECQVIIQVIYLPQDMPGPQKFELDVGDKTCL